MVPRTQSLVKTGSILLLAVLATVGTACGKPQLDKVEDSKVDAQRRDKALEIGSRILTDWAKDSYPKLGEAEAAEEFRKAHNADDAQEASDKALEKQLGNFESMAYHETLRSKDGKLEVYRFKGRFQQASEMEVRVVFDAAAKLTGFWVKPWKDQI